MKIKAFVFTYNRPDMLAKVLDDLNSYGITPTVKNDGVDFKHRGKRLFWLTWSEMLTECRNDPADIYLFMPDDFLDIDIERIKQYHSRYNRTPYVYNLINDGRLEQWVRFEPKEIDKDTIQIGFTDCGFFCNRSALDKIGYKMTPIPDKYFDNPRINSSGVGRQLTLRFFGHRVPTYLPKKSLAFHGDHESVMHPEERKINPLISK